MAGKHNLFQRNGIWWFRKAHQGKQVRISLETRNLRKAQARRDNILRDLDAGKWGEAKNKTFNDAVMRWIDNHLPTLKPKSRMRYKVSLSNLLEDFDNVQIDKITASLMSDFEARRRKMGASNPTIRRDLACLSSLLTHCEDWDWIVGNPASAYLRKRSRSGLKESPANTRYLSLQEEESLLAAGSPTLVRAASFAIDTGLRKEEQFSLLKSDVSLVDSTVNVRKEIAKSSRARKVPLLPRSKEIARELLNASGPYLFVSATGDRYSDKSRTFYTRLQAAAKRAGIAKLSWHDLRRTCGCRLLNVHGLKMHEVSMWLGHSSVQMTERAYAFVEQERLGDLIHDKKKFKTG